MLRGIVSKHGRALAVGALGGVGVGSAYGSPLADTQKSSAKCGDDNQTIFGLLQEIGAKVKSIEASLGAEGLKKASGYTPKTASTGKVHGIDIVLGSQWGDEGKGKLVDILSQTYDVCARVAGGSNAGHTIVVEGKKIQISFASLWNS